VEGVLLRVAVPQRGRTVMEAARRLDRAGIAVEDISLHRPTLDDVFLSLTGHAANETEMEVAA
ncbi:MAG TPA: daunorubicin/doxorubicin resistance ABC transporter ATP-binding protein DrrA, partial [Solirubrobacteraceae bacterium]|nr:daunorubicin/doxorubicin resistance ABC transporter ATP-binding protein DrrA [Solirubrobacteraceae bacterium]